MLSAASWRTRASSELRVQRVSDGRTIVVPAGNMIVITHGATVAPAPDAGGGGGRSSKPFAFS